MTNHNDRDTQAYLWDPKAGAGGVDPALVALEQRLATLSFDAVEQPLPRPLAKRAVWHRSSRWLAFAAAALVLVAAGGVWFLQWRWTWPEGRAWAIASGPASAPSAFAVGAPLELARNEGAVIDVARIGTMRVEGGSRVLLRSTQGTRHRLDLEHGRVSVRVWAPPGSVAFQTPAGEVIDLGCEFDLEVEGVVARVSVRSGWVQLENGLDESLIPAGSSSEMARNRAPGVPVFDDANPRFRDAVRRYEATNDARVADDIAATARPRDVFTLLMLIERGQGPGLSRLASRAAELAPLPEGVTVNGIVRGDREGLWRWRDTLTLPPPKGWIRNWRDALPDWLAGRPR